MANPVHMDAIRRWIMDPNRQPSSVVANAFEALLKTATTADTASSAHTTDIAALTAEVAALEAAIEGDEADAQGIRDTADLALALATSGGVSGSTTPPGGTPGQVQFNSAGSFGGFTLGGDATLDTSTGLITVAQAAKLTTARNIAITGDLAWNVTFDGSAAVTAAGTLATVNSNVGAFGSGTSVASFTVNAKGLITAAANVAITSAPKWTTGRTITLTGDTTGVSAAFDGSANLTITTVGAQAAKWTTARTLSFTGDVTGSGSVDGSANVATALTIANSAVTLAKIANAAASSKLLGSGSSGSGAAYSELSLGTGLAMSGTTLSATAAGAPSFGIYEASATKPLASSFSWVNQGDASLTDGTGSLILTAPLNASVNVRMIVQTAPAATYVIYFRGMPEAAAAGTVSFGLILRNSTSGRFLFLAFTSPSATVILQRVWQRWASATAFNANINTAVSQWMYTPWFRITVTSTTATPEMSPNGWDWSAAGVAETLSTYVTATGGTVDQVGIGVQVNNGSGVYHLNAFQTTAPT